MLATRTTRIVAVLSIVAMIAWPRAVAADNPATCMGAVASVTPSTISAGGVATFTASGFAPSSRVNLRISGPSPSPPATITAGPDCRASTPLQALPSDLPGTYVATASGTSVDGRPVTATATFTLQDSPTSQLSPASPFGPGPMGPVATAVVPPPPAQGPQSPSQMSFTVTPSAGPPGTSVSVSSPGMGQTPCVQVVSRVQVLWDGQLPVAQTTLPTPCSPWSVSFTVPTGATAGPHSVVVLTGSNESGPSRTFTVTSQVPGDPCLPLERLEYPVPTATGFYDVTGGTASTTAGGMGSPQPPGCTPPQVPANVLPVCSIDGPMALDVTQIGRYVPNAYDPDGVITRWHWSGSGGSPNTQTFSAPTQSFDLVPHGPGQYQLSLTVTDNLGGSTTCRATVNVIGPLPPPIVAQPPLAQLPTSTPPPVPPILPPVEPPLVPQGPPAPAQGQERAAPLAVDQSITIVGGAQVPTIGQTTQYEHVTRLRNTSARALDFSTALSPGMVIAFSQGEAVTSTYETQYAPDAQITSATASTGQTTVRGASLVWTGQLAAGESAEVHVRIDHVPTQEMVSNQIIRGQSLVVSDPRGLSLVVPPVARPQLPVQARIVQPAPPPVDPVTGSRFFPDTGFSVVNDAIWNYYHRRGGQRTFGQPISRLFTLGGTQMQLFERGLLQVNEQGHVAVANLLEEPFLPFNAYGDFWLPDPDGEVLANAPDPALPNFGDASQEFVRVYAAEDFDNNPTRFYTTFLGTVLFREAFFDGRGDPSLVPGFSLEIWGLPTTTANYLVLRYEPDPDGGPDVPVVDRAIVVQRFQRGIMRYDAASQRTAGIPLGVYLRAVMTGEALPDLAQVAAETTPLWALYNPEAVAWVDRPDDVPDTNLVLAFVREDDADIATEATTLSD